MPRNLQWEYIIYVFMDEGGISDNIMSVIGTDNGEVCKGGLIGPNGVVVRCPNGSGKVYDESMQNEYPEYKALRDRELVELALQGNEEAVLYLIYERYDPLLKKLCRRYYQDLFFYEQLQTELYIHLKSRDWHALRSFNWRSTFGTWIGVVAANLFKRKMPELIGIGKFMLSIGEDIGNGEVNIPDPEPVHEHNMDMVLLIESVHLLEDKDQRYILLKEFDGYEPREIAKLLEDYRRKEGRLKIRKNADGTQEEIIPSVEYIHMLKSRARNNICAIINRLREEIG